ncbi:MAG: hypothetical protein IAE65_02795 [Ignavibacteria bacterium]|nr:hypothetical protein [Ignavibacteria bacterium]
MRTNSNPQETFNNAVNEQSNQVSKPNFKNVNKFTIPEIEEIVKNKMDETKKSGNDEFPGSEKTEEFVHPDKKIKNPNSTDEKKN